MAKLTVRWPRITGFGERFGHWRILIDGRDVASIDFGKMVEIELPPGRHQVRVGGFLRSPPVDIDCGPEETHQLAVGPDTHPIYRLLFGASVVLAMLPNLGLQLWLSGQGLQRHLAAIESGLSLLLVPATALPLLLQIPFLFFMRSHFLDLREVRSVDWTDQQIFEFMRAQARRVRITIGQVMIVVAIAAVYLGAAVQWARFQRRDFFRSRASLHASHEQTARESQQRFLGSLANLERAGAGVDMKTMGETGRLFLQSVAWYRQDAAKAATRADFHAALRRKYEQAAAERWFTVEPDPPQSEWP